MVLDSNVYTKVVLVVDHPLAQNAEGLLEDPQGFQPNVLVLLAVPLVLQYQNLSVMVQAVGPLSSVRYYVVVDVVALVTVVAAGGALEQLVISRVIRVY